MARVTLFTFGYFGWGNHTPHLVEAVDAVETSRGFRPPMFVDIRIRRSVRAKGFTGPTFETLVGCDRHVWMNSLGNRFIQTRTGPPIQIADPKAADELLDLAIGAAAHKQRILFFCSCQWAKDHGKVACHRATVAGLLLREAKERRMAVEVVEWPGGEPTHVRIDVSARDFKTAKSGRTTVPVSSDIELSEIAGLPWCSIATLRSDREELHRIVGPAVRRKGAWCLPVVGDPQDPGQSLTTSRRCAKDLRASFGLEPFRLGK